MTSKRNIVVNVNANLNVNLNICYTLVTNMKYAQTDVTYYMPHSALAGWGIKMREHCPTIVLPNLQNKYHIIEDLTFVVI